MRQRRARRRARDRAGPAALRSTSDPCGRRRRPRRRGPRTHSLPPTELLQQALDPVFVVGLGGDGQRLVEDRIAAAGASDFSGWRRRLVALPSSDLVVDEIDGELAMLERLSLACEQVGVIPAIGVERIGEHRRSQRTLDLLPRLPDLEAVDLILGYVVTLVDVQLVDTETGEPSTSPQDQREYDGAKHRAHRIPRPLRLRKTTGNYIIGVSLLGRGRALRSL